MLGHDQELLDKYQHPYLGVCIYVKQIIKLDKGGCSHRIYIQHNKVELGGDLFVCDVGTFAKDFIPYKIEGPDIEI
jgi:hypothetical protein